MNTDISYDISDWKFYDSSLLIELSPAGAYPIQSLWQLNKPGKYEPILVCGNSPDAVLDKILITTSSAELLQYEQLSLDEMLKEAGTILDGREFTDLGKQKYYINET